MPRNLLRWPPFRAEGPLGRRATKDAALRDGWYEVWPEIAATGGEASERISGDVLVWKVYTFRHFV
jgi:hypothetical protein